MVVHGDCGGVGVRTCKHGSTPCEGGAVGLPAVSWTDTVPGESVVPMVAGQVGVVVGSGSGGSSVTPAAATALCASV